MKRVLIVVAMLLVVGLAMLCVAIVYFTPVSESHRDAALAKLVDVAAEHGLDRPIATPFERTTAPVLTDEERYAAYAELVKRGDEAIGYDAHDRVQWFAVRLALALAMEVEEYRGGSIAGSTFFEDWGIDAEFAAEVRSDQQQIIREGRHFIEDLVETVRLGGPAWPLGSESDESTLATIDPEKAVYRLRGYLDVLLLDAHLRAEQGDFHGAGRNFVAALQLEAVLRESEFNDGYLSDLRLGDIYEHYQIVFRNEVPPREIAHALVAELTAGKTGNRLARSFLQDMQWQVGFREAWKQTGYLEQVEIGGIYWGSRNWIWSRPVCRPLFNQDEAKMAELTAKLVAAASLPYFQAKPQIELLRNQIEDLSPVQHNTKKLIHKLEDFIGHANQQVKMDLMRLAIAVDQHQVEFGSYPQSLSEVAHLLGGELPMNPFTGKPYHYKPHGGRYKLFAVVEEPDSVEAMLAEHGFEMGYADVDGGSAQEPEVVLNPDQVLLVWREGNWWTSFGGYIVEYVPPDPDILTHDGDEMEAGFAEGRVENETPLDGP